jgi:glycosyltransferase involved in cell wall biosynthesis
VSLEGIENASRLPSISLFLPLHDEEGNVEEAVRRALATLPGVADEYEVILVDDGSRDRTGLIADRLAARDRRIRVVHHPANCGYGAALRSGIAACRHEWIFYTDGDNQFDIREIVLLLPLSREHDIVSGYRIDRRDHWIRKLNASVFKLAIRLFFGLRLRDVDCAFKLYRASIFDGLKLTSDGALIDVEILAGARARGARIAEVGVHHYPRMSGTQSGARPSVVVRAMREIVRLWWSTRRR